MAWDPIGKGRTPGQVHNLADYDLRFVEISSERTGRQIAEDDYPHLATLASAVKFLAGN